jgi:hypothetical protein
VDAPVVALVQELEGAVVAAPDRGDEAMVVSAGLCNHARRRFCNSHRSPTHGEASLLELS